LSTNAARSAEARYFRVGIFVFLGLVAIAAVALVLGGRSFFAETVLFETYFDESVQGLEVGSPVKLRGVHIGRVTQIDLVTDVYEIPEDQAERFHQLVIVRFEALEKDLPRGAIPWRERLRPLEEKTDRGFRLQLRQAGITGVVFIEGTYVDPVRNPPLRVPWQPEAIYVPSTPSTISALASAAERFAARLEQVQAERVLANFDALVVSLRELAEGLDAPELQRDVTATLAELRGTMAELRRQLGAANVPALSAEARALLGESQALLSRTRRVLDGGSHDLSASLENLRVASDNLRDLSETLKGQPSLLLRGSPPERSPLKARDGEVPE
jgi:phospholipid/cholesterol/gamma-HCH transport system substrate-binding protein/paraquat-inducible protein B